MRRARDAGGVSGNLDRLRRHRYGGLIEPLALEAPLLVKSMFGCLACYLHGRLMLVLADRREPWCGLLVPTTRAAQPALRAEIRSLAVHPVLRKWLHLRESVDDFEDAAARLVALVRADDPRVGVESPARHAGPRSRTRERRELGKPPRIATPVATKRPPVAPSRPRSRARAS